MAAALFTVATEADAKKRRPQPAELALLPTTVTDDVNLELLGALEAELDRGARGLYAAVYSGDALQGRLKGSPQEAGSKCRADLACLVRLGKRAKVDDVLYGVATLSNNGVSLTASLVNVAKGRLEGTATFVLAEASEAAASVKAGFSDLFRAPYPDAGTADLALPDLVALSAPDLAPLPPPNRAPAPDADHGEPAPPTPQSERPTAARPPADTGAAVSRTSPPHEARGAWLAYTGFAVVGVGALLAVAGIVPGLKSKDDYNQIKPDTDMITAGDLKQSSYDNADRANLLWMLGGTLAAVGGALVAVDRFILADVTPSATASPTGVRATLRWRF